MGTGGAALPRVFSVGGRRRARGQGEREGQPAERRGKGWVFAGMILPLQTPARGRRARVRGSSLESTSGGACTRRRMRRQTYFIKGRPRHHRRPRLQVRGGRGGACACSTVTPPLGPTYLRPRRRDAIAHTTRSGARSPGPLASGLHSPSLALRRWRPRSASASTSVQASASAL
eukprot:scaffold4116_cov338-Prasinococcus_capsulatus_cf.AAC.2